MKNNIAWELIQPFYNWLNDPPDTGDDDEDVDTSYETLGLKTDAPHEAVEAFNRYLEAIRNAEELNEKI